MDETAPPLRRRSTAPEPKRLRTRRKLLDAARQVFSERGWADAKVADIADEAGVSAATAYNHFSSKHELLGYAYAPLLEPVIAQVRSDIEAQRDPIEAITSYVHTVLDLARQHQRLTTALLAAVHEQTIQVNGPPVDPADVRFVVPLPLPLELLIDDGQKRGLLNDEVPAKDIAVYHTNSMLLRVFTRPGEPAADTAHLVLSQLLPAIVPRPNTSDG